MNSVKFLYNLILWGHPKFEIVICLNCLPDWYGDCCNNIVLPA